MSLLQEKSQDTLQPQPVPPTFSQLFLFLLLLGWLGVSPVVVGLVTSFLPSAWPSLAHSLLAITLLAGLLLIPLPGFAWLVRQRHWNNLKPLTGTWWLTALYILASVTLRVAFGSDDSTISHDSSLPAISLRLSLLTLVALSLGGLGWWWAGGPRDPKILARLFGLNNPSIAGLFFALALIALLTAGWPLTGALGDTWISGLILLQVLASSLPEEIFFRGVILGLLTYHFQQRRVLAGLVAILTYLAFTPGLILPYGEWGKLFLPITALPLVLLVTELRLLTGSIWAGLLLVWVYRASPLLFTDPRVELPLLTQPWQTAAHIWMFLGTGGLALTLWGGWHWLRPRWPLSGRVTRLVALGVALFFGGLWLGLWLKAGRPGFHNDGFLIIMAEQADLSGAEEIDDLIARRTFVRERLLETARRTQVPVREALDAAGLSYRPFYLINMIQVEGQHRRMADFAELPGVARVMLNPNVRPYPFRFDFGYGDTPDEERGPGWNVRQVQADQVWARGITGQGIVVAGQDTGYDWQHPALRRAYRGYQAAGQADHNYNWHDAWSDTTAPFDDGQHGTHTMGTILGDDGQGQQIGLAPGARWIGCRNMQRGLGNPASYAECMEFFLAPYPLGGDPFTQGEVTLAPDVINNSWGCPDIEGCDDEVLQPAMAALRATGIMMVVSAGNDGPGCQTVNEPPARYDEVFSVGATDQEGVITGFSSRGPVPEAELLPPAPLLKPDIVAPGDNIRSSIPGEGYGLASGTSMAGPHVTGLVVLLWSANPALIGQIDRTEQIIRQSAQPVGVSASCPVKESSPDQTAQLETSADLPVEESCACGDVTGRPNNVYGWGQIDALAAIKLGRAGR